MRNGAVIGFSSARALALAGAAGLLAGAPALAQTPAPQQFTTPPANTLPFSRVIELGSGVSMLMGAGGNIGLLTGPDGVFVIDNQFVTNAAANLAKIEELAGSKPRYLVNTHWHFDHAGGNEVFQTAGAKVFAHANARRRLSGEIVSPNPQQNGRPRETFPAAAWPVVTFTAGVDFHLNGQTIRAIPVGPAHTDGDVLVHFAEADVIHMGDTYMKDRYPFVDVGSGGRQAGFIQVMETALRLAGPQTKIIPGHGELAARADLEAVLEMHKGARAAVEARVKAGDTLAQAVAAKPLARWTPRFGPQGGFISEDAFVTVIYTELKSASN